MRRLLSLAAALVMGGTLVSATAIAQAPTGYYVAVPAKAPTRTALMTRATPWSLSGAAYVAARAPERDAVLCQLVVKNAGALSSFTVGGKPFDADALAKCNGKAKAEAVAAR